MPVGSLWFIALGVVFFVLLGFSIWLLVEYFKEKRKVEDKPFAFNFCSHLPGGDGRFFGIEHSVQLGKKNRYFITLDPKDISVTNEAVVPMVEVVVDSNKRISLAKGRPSKERDIIFYLPPNPEDIPSELQDSVIGKAMMWATKLKNYEKTVVEILREGTDRRDKLLKEMGDGEISKEFLEYTTGLVQDYLGKIINPKDIKDKSSSINLTGSGSSGSSSS